MYSTASPWTMRGFEQCELPLCNFLKKVLFPWATKFLNCEWLLSANFELHEFFPWYWKSSCSKTLVHGKKKQLSNFKAITRRPWALQKNILCEFKLAENSIFLEIIEVLVLQFKCVKTSRIAWKVSKNCSKKKKGKNYILDFSREQDSFFFLEKRSHEQQRFWPLI